MPNNERASSSTGKSSQKTVSHYNAGFKGSKMQTMLRPEPKVHAFNFFLRIHGDNEKIAIKAADAKLLLKRLKLDSAKHIEVEKMTESKFIW